MAEKNHSKLEKVFYLIILPMIFTAVLLMILLNFLGVPVWKTIHQWGEHIPGVNSTSSATANKQDQTTSSHDQTKSQSFQTMKIQQTANQQEVDKLKKENSELQKELADNQTQKDKAEMQQVANLYANMSTSKAVAILENLPLDDAAFTLSSLDEDQQSSLLGSFSDPKKAAQLSTLMKEITLHQDEDPVLLKKHIHDLAQKGQTPTASTLVQTISAMPPAQSAGIIENLMGTNINEAIYLMQSLDTNIRSQVLTEIAKSNAPLAAKISTYLN